MLGGCAPHPWLTVPPAILADDWSPLPTTPSPDRASLDRAEPDHSVAVGEHAGAGIDLGSPRLRALIADALRQSPTLIGAQARVDQAQALLRSARGATLPVVTASASPLLSQSRRGGPLDFSQSFGSLDAGLTVDVGGRLKAGKRAAADRLRASAFDRDALTIAVAAEIARAFVTQAAIDARLALLARNIAQTEELLRIIQVRQREGSATQIDVGLQDNRVQNLRTERERLRQSLDQSRTALALLVGSEAPLFRSTPGDLSALVGPTPSIPGPADLIRHRPDILAAEARLAAAGGDVTRARAAFIPPIELALGRAAQASLGTPLLSSIVLSANMLAPIFNRGQLKADLELASARQREAVQSYRQAILQSFVEVENARSAVSYAQARAVLLDRIVETAERTVRLDRQRYLEGDADLRDLLVTQDEIITAQDARLLNQQERIEAQIELYRASSSAITDW